VSSAASSSAFGQNFRWDNRAGGDWLDPANWNIGGRTTGIDSPNPQVDGTLRVELVSGYTPVFGDTADIFAARGTGEFSTLDLPVLPAPLVSRVRYRDTGIAYIVSCEVDLDGNGVLDIFDVISFLGSFDAGDPSADLAGPPGMFDIFDVLAFLGQFDAGC
ncbi:MAG: GC-type dockerin domain-anchored protein, partial [Planctomycetota bacterium]